MTLEEFLRQWSQHTSNFNLCVGTPLEDGTLTVYFHSDDGLSPTRNYAVRGDLIESLDAPEVVPDGV